MSTNNIYILIRFYPKPYTCFENKCLINVSKMSLDIRTLFCMISYDLGAFQLKMTTNQYGTIWHEAIWYEETTTSRGMT